MRNEISRFEIENELDLVLAHKRATQICDLTGVNLPDQTRFATAISEICRNCLEYATGGMIIFRLVQIKEGFRIEAHIIDSGKGIRNLDEVLREKRSLPNGRGKGLSYSKKLVDKFSIESDMNGTRVLLCQNIPAKHPPINNIIVNGWKQHFQKEESVSPYEEIKKRNKQLLQISEDLSLKKAEAEQQLRENKRLMHELERNHDTLKEFAFAISHDLRTPLTTLQLWASMAADTEDPLKKNKWIGKANLSIKRLNDTIMGLVQIIDTQKDPGESARPLNFDALIESIKDENWIQLKNIGGRIITELEKTEIVFVEAYIKSILSNLITNAIKYHSDDRKLDIRITTRKEGEFVLLQVEDNGIGMDLNKALPSLFKPFTRFTSKSEGRGIGLHIIKNMIEKNSGKIEVRSEPNVGSVFMCFLQEYKVSEGTQHKQGATGLARKI